MTLKVEIIEQLPTASIERGDTAERSGTPSPLIVCRTTITNLLKDAELLMELTIIESTPLMKLVADLVDTRLGISMEKEDLIIRTETAEDGLEFEELLIPFEKLGEELLISTEDLEDFFMLLLTYVITDNGGVGTLTLLMEDSTGEWDNGG